MLARTRPIQFINFVQREIDSSGASNKVMMLQGVRGAAILLVLSSHTNFLGLSGVGGLGVWIFLCLSGYLLSQRFLSRPQRVTVSEYFDFLMARSRRILPLYFFCVLFISAGLSPDPILFLKRNLLMTYGDDHLWSIRLEVFLYLFFPFLWIFILADSNGGKVSIFVPLLLVLLGWQGNRFYIVSVGEITNFYALPFFLGIFVASLERVVVHYKTIKRWTGFLTDVVFLMFILMAWFSSLAHVKTLHEAGILLGVEAPVWALWREYSVFSSIIIFLVVYSPGKISGKILTSVPMRVFGILAYSLYLSHFPVLALVDKICGGIKYSLLEYENILRFSVLMLIEIPFSMVLYVCVERRFWKPGYMAEVPKEKRFERPIPTRAGS